MSPVLPPVAAERGSSRTLQLCPFFIPTYYYSRSQFLSRWSHRWSVFLGKADCPIDVVDLGTTHSLMQEESLQLISLKGAIRGAPGSESANIQQSHARNAASQSGCLCQSQSSVQCKGCLHQIKYTNQTTEVGLAIRSAFVFSTSQNNSTC